MSICSCVETCPQCGKETLAVEFDLNTEEVDEFCEFCGYKHYKHIKKDDDNNPIYCQKEYPLSNVHIGNVSYLDGVAKSIIPISEIEEPCTQKILEMFERKNGKGFYGNLNANNLLFIKNQNIEILLSSNTEFKVDNDKLVVSKLVIEEETRSSFGHILVCDGEIIYQENFEKDILKENAMGIVNQKLSLENIEWVFASWYNTETKEYEVLYETKPGIIIQE